MDLKAFNLALLAKQGWRLQTCQSALLYKVYKARYFPHGDFLTAELGNNPSFAWQSIFSTQSIVHKGYRWQVGNGASIDIRRDKWLPSPDTFKVISPPVALPIGMTVDNLIDPHHGTWQGDLILHTFSPDDARSIISIPLSSRLPSDWLIWAYTSKGNFTVRSAYRIALSSSSDQRPKNSSSGNRSSFWKNVWRLNVPNKIKSFAWQASRKILPTKDNLCHRKVLNDLICEAYGLIAESCGHLF